MCNKSAWSPASSFGASRPSQPPGVPLPPWRVGGEKEKEKVKEEEEEEEEKEKEKEKEEEGEKEKEKEK